MPNVITIVLTPRTTTKKPFSAPAAAPIAIPIAEATTTLVPWNT